MSEVRRPVWPCETVVAEVRWPGCVRSETWHTWRDFMTPDWLHPSWLAAICHPYSVHYDPGHSGIAPRTYSRRYHHGLTLYTGRPHIESRILPLGAISHTSIVFLIAIDYDHNTSIVFGVCLFCRDGSKKYISSDIQRLYPWQ